MKKVRVVSRPARPARPVTVIYRRPRLTAPEVIEKSLGAERTQGMPSIVKSAGRRP